MPWARPPRVFLALAALFAVAAAFHVAALVRPALAEPSPPWRHALFAALNVAVAVGAWRRPPGFVVAFALLTAQQLASHGADAARVWRDERRVDGASGVVLIGMPVALGLLLADARASRRRRGR